MDWVERLTATFWSSLRHCPQLLSLCICAASPVAVHAAFKAIAGSAPHVSRAYTAAFPALTNLELSSDDRSYVDPRGFAELIGDFHGPPMEGRVGRALQRHSTGSHRVTEEHHSTAMTYYWRDGLLGEEEDELRMKHAKGVRAATSRWTLGWPERSYKLFRKADNGKEDGRVNSFHRSMIE